MIVLVAVMLIGVILMQVKKKKDVQVMNKRGDRIEMRNKHSSESNMNLQSDANNGLLSNDAIAMNKQNEKNNHVLLKPMAAEQVPETEIDDEYELTSTDNDDD